MKKKNNKVKKTRTTDYVKRVSECVYLMKSGNYVVRTRNGENKFYHTYTNKKKAINAYRQLKSLK